MPFAHGIIEEKKLFELDSEGKPPKESDSETSSQEDSSESGKHLQRALLY